MSFILRILDPKQKFVIVIFIMALLGTLYSLYNSFIGNAVINSAISLIALVDSLVWIRGNAEWRALDEDRKPDPELTKLIQKIELSDEYVNSGYQKECVPRSEEEYIVRSERVDSMIRERGNDFQIEYCRELIDRILSKLQANAYRYKNVLQFKRQSASRKGKLFFNESKTCLGSDMLCESKSAKIYKGEYFISILTNEIVKDRYVRHYNGYEEFIYFGHQEFPLVYINDERFILKSIEESRMGNHIGVSTIAHTNDKKIVIWKQMQTALQNTDKLVSTGSGSSDYKDWEKSGSDSSLLQLIKVSMNREFLEESTSRSKYLKDRGEDDLVPKTWVVGFFRWLRRGGKPEFVGITKTSVDAIELSPDGKEVIDSDEIVAYDAKTICDFIKSLQDIIDSKRISIGVSLYANARVLIEAAEEKPDELANFLDIYNNYSEDA